MTRIRILTSAAALVGAGMIGGLVGIAQASSSPAVYSQSNTFQVAESPVRLADRLPLTAGVPAVIEVPRLAQWVTSYGETREMKPQPINAAVVNLTVVDPADAGYVTAWSGNGAAPNASSVNFDADVSLLSNEVTVGLSGGETFTVVSSVDAELVVDLNGTYDRVESGGNVP